MKVEQQRFATVLPLCRLFHLIPGQVRGEMPERGSKKNPTLDKTGYSIYTLTKTDGISRELTLRKEGSK